jgi:RNA polymerase sigma-70 factor (ECF subfamily)
VSQRHPPATGLFDLMERYVDGDPVAFARLHGHLQTRLRGLLMRLVRDEAVVDDLVQLALLKAHLARDRFFVPGGDPDGAVQGWYFAIARNVAMDHLRERYRSQRRHAPAGDDEADPIADLATEAPNPEEHGEHNEHAQIVVERVRDAIARLPAGQREVVELHKLQGMSMAEVADRLQVREGAVRVRAHRAYRALARILGTSRIDVLLVAWSASHTGPDAPSQRRVEAAGTRPPHGAQVMLDAIVQPQHEHLVHRRWAQIDMNRGDLPQGDALASTPPAERDRASAQERGAR